jgi:glycine/D-amino acid oxidase-like deaminating enzyme
MRVIVVGSGLLGAATAWNLAGAGHEVLVVEAATPGGAASRASFGWVNAQNKAPHAYYELNARGLDEHRRLAAALGDDSWLHGGGDLNAGSGEAGAGFAAKAATMEALGYPVRRIDRTEAAALEPDMALPEGDDAVFVWYPEEGWLEAAPLVGRLLTGVRARGGSVRAGTPVAAIETTEGRATGVRLPDGERLAADVVVLAAGNGSGRLAATAGVHLPMAPTPGLLAVTTPEAAGPRRIIHFEALTLRPDGCGRTLFASRHLDADLPPDLESITLDDPAVARLVEAGVRAYPALAAADIETVRVGRRSVAADQMPVAGFAPGVDGLYLLVTHSGATLTAILGRLAAQEVAGVSAPELEPYRLTAERFPA